MKVYFWLLIALLFVIGCSAAQTYDDSSAHPQLVKWWSLTDGGQKVIQVSCEGEEVYVKCSVIPPAADFDLYLVEETFYLMHYIYRDQCPDRPAFLSQEDVGFYPDYFQEIYDPQRICVYTRFLTVNCRY